MTGRRGVLALPVAAALGNVRPGCAPAEWSLAVATARPVALSGVRLAPPLQPPSVRDLITFERHVEGALRTVVLVAAVPPECAGVLLHLAWSFPELLSYASRRAWARAGDVIGSGTCGGGCLAELWGRAGRPTAPTRSVEPRR